MYLSKLELNVLEQIAKGTNDIPTIAQHLKRHKSRIYRVRQNLIDQGLLDRSSPALTPKKTTHVTLLLQLLANHPNLTQNLSDSGFQIYTLLLTPQTIRDLCKETDLKKSIIYKKIHQGLTVSALIRKENHTYTINEKLWNDLRECLQEIKKFEDTTDPRIPTNSTIYHKNTREIVFSNRAAIDATPTGFSAYEQYNLKLLLPMHYYYLPKKALTKKEVFLHSLYITKKAQEIRYFTYLALFYVKYRKELLDVHHAILDNIRQILQGKHIKGYPSYEDIKEKADVYDLRL
jgi:predicted transcriptional regulator